MRTHITVCFIIILGLSSIGRAETRVEDLNPPSKVIGLLGKPLGTRLVVYGVQAKCVMLANPLTVSEVDGKMLKDPVCMEIRGKFQVTKDTPYRLEGYEAGEFSGPPNWLAPEIQQPFQYRSYFVVTKVIEPKPK